MENNTISQIPEFTIVIDDIDLTTNEQTTNDNVDETTDKDIDTSVTVEETTTTEVTTEEEKSTYNEDADPNAIAFYEELKERGYLTESFDGTWDSLDQMFTELPNKILQSLIEQAPDITKQVVRFAFSSNDITQEDLVNFVKVYNEELSGDVEITTMDEARDYLEKVYSEKGLSKKAIEATLNSLEDDDELLDEAKTLKEKESKFTKTEQLIAGKENEEIARKQEMLNFSNKLASELQETNWKPARIDKVKNVLTGNNLSEKLNDVIKNPKAIVKLADFLSYYNNGDIDYSTFIKQLETPVAKDLKSRIESAFNSPGVNTKSYNTNKHTIIDIENEKPII